MTDTDTDPDLAFETLIYTDCRPGEGLQGTAGLQFQARSPGADREAMSVVQRNLLYEPPSSWMRAKRAVADYPPSFAHVYDGLYATAAGVYRGREANGGREGNQLTHGIITRNPAAYGLIRPAQLFGAPFWTVEPATSTTCEPVADGWEPGPFDAEEAQEFVLAAARGADRLRALVSVLDRVGEAGARRVLFIAEDPAAVLCWITAATLLMPQERALRIGLKVFTTNPAYAAQPVVAVHPAWESTSATVANDSGYAVFDLVTGDWSTLDPSPEADQRVRMFCEHDPYDVVDLIEIAGGTGERPADALELGRAMVLPDSELTERTANLAVEWLRKTEPTRLAAHRGDLVNQLTAAVERWPLGVLRSLDEVARAGQVPAGHVPAVRLALVRAEIENALREHTVVDTMLPPLAAGVWQDEHRRAGVDLVVEALSREVPAAAVDAVLRVAKRFDLAVPPEEIPKATWALIGDWADHPHRGYEVERWPGGPELERMLFEELAARVVAGQSDRIGDDWWERLIGRDEDAVGQELHRAVVGAAMVYAPDEQCHSLIRRSLAGLPADATTSKVDQSVEALWHRRYPSFAEFGLLCEVLPAGPVLSDQLFTLLVRRLRTEPMSREALDLAHDLVRRGLFRPDESVRRLLDGDANLETVCAGLSAVVEDAECGRYARMVRGAAPGLVELWASRLVAGLLEVPEPVLVPTLLEALPRKTVLVYLEHLCDAVRESGRPPQVVALFYLSMHPRQDVKVRGVLRSELVDWIARSPERRLKPVRRAVAEVDRDWPRFWATYESFAQDRSRWRLPRWRRGDDS
jgi:hypothetical protein